MPTVKGFLVSEEVEGFSSETTGDIFARKNVKIVAAIEMVISLKVRMAKTILRKMFIEEW